MGAKKSMKFKLYKWQLGVVGIYNQIFNPPISEISDRFSLVKEKPNKSVIIRPKVSRRIGLIRKY